MITRIRMATSIASSNILGLTAFCRGNVLRNSCVVLILKFLHLRRLLTVLLLLITVQLARGQVIVSATASYAHSIMSEVNDHDNNFTPTSEAFNSFDYYHIATGIPLSLQLQLAAPERLNLGIRANFMQSFSTDNTHISHESDTLTTSRSTRNLSIGPVISYELYAINDKVRLFQEVYFPLLLQARYLRKSIYSSTQAGTLLEYRPLKRLGFATNFRLDIDLSRQLQLCLLAGINLQKFHTKDETFYFLTNGTIDPDEPVHYREHAPIGKPVSNSTLSIPKSFSVSLSYIHAGIGASYRFGKG